MGSRSGEDIIMFKLVVLALAVSQVLARSTKIVGGEDASPGEFPHQCALEFASSGSHTCGCSILSDRWVITAAHCTQSSASRYQVVVGQHDRVTNNEGRPEIHYVSRIINHPNYGQGSGAFPNDISLIQLSTAIDMSNPFVSAINLAEGSQDYAGQRCIISGWGRLYGGGPLPNVLQKAETTVLSNSQCSSYWGSNINAGHVCIFNSGDGITSCNGDSGGPLVCGNTLVGVTSWGPTGCLTYLPAGYTRVSYFRDWIRQNAGV